MNLKTLLIFILIITQSYVEAITYHITDSKKTVTFRCEDYSPNQKCSFLRCKDNSNRSCIFSPKHGITMLEGDTQGVLACREIKATKITGESNKLAVCRSNTKDIDQKAREYLFATADFLKDKNNEATYLSSQIKSLKLLNQELSKIIANVLYTLKDKCKRSLKEVTGRDASLKEEKF